MRSRSLSWLLPPYLWCVHFICPSGSVTHVPWEAGHQLKLAGIIFLVFLLAPVTVYPSFFILVGHKLSFKVAKIGDLLLLLGSYFRCWWSCDTVAAQLLMDLEGSAVFSKLTVFLHFRTQLSDFYRLEIIGWIDFLFHLNSEACCRNIPNLADWNRVGLILQPQHAPNLQLHLPERLGLFVRLKSVIN